MLPKQHSQMGPSQAQLGPTGAQLGPIWNAAWVGNIGDLFVKCMRQVTKGHSFYLLGVSDY